MLARTGRPRLPDKVYTQMRLEPQVMNKLKYIAMQESRSMNAQVEYLVIQCINRYESEHGEILLPETDETE